MRQAQVPESLAGMRFDRIAAQLFGEFSRGQLQRWIASGELLADGRARAADARLPCGCLLCLDAMLVPAHNWLAQQMELNIVHSDEALMVVDKPAGLVVHPGAGNPDGTLLNGLIHLHPQLRDVPRAGIVHRLDKDTSGLMVVARNAMAHAHLTAELQERRVARHYLALVRGLVGGDGTVDVAIGRHRTQRTKMAAVPRAAASGARPAVTHYRVLQRYNSHSLLHLRLDTGRTHQIRVHLAHLGHPVVGDASYGRGARDGFGRQALHATRLGLLHPLTGADAEWHSAMPDDMRRLAERLGAASGGAGG